MVVDGVEDELDTHEDVNVSVEVDMVGTVARAFGMVRFAVDVMWVDNSEFVGKTLTMQSTSRILTADGKVHEDTTLGDCSMYVEDVHDAQGIVDYVVLEERCTVVVGELTIRQ